MKSTTFGLDSEKITKLLHMGLGVPGETEEASDSCDRSALLERWLKGRLPSHAMPTKVSPLEPSGKTLPLGVLLGMPIGELLGPRTSMDVLMALKDYAKAQVKASKSPEIQDAATVIYYAVIACAWVEHGQMISSISLVRLQQATTKLAEKPWVSSDIKTWFERAEFRPDSADSAE